MSQISGSIGGPLVKDRTFFFATADYTRQNRTAFLNPTLPSFVLPADGNLAYVGHYRQTLFDGRVDHTFNSKQTLMFRMNLDNRLSERMSLLLRLEGFNIFNHGNFLGRGVTNYGDLPAALPTFGQFVGAVGTSSNAIPAFANIDPPRMFQLQARFVF